MSDSTQSEPHHATVRNVEALQDSAVLLTIAWPEEKR